AVRGMVKTLGDRYTRFLSPDQFRRMEEENSGEFGGVGILVSLSGSNQARVSSVEAGGPASRAGVRVGDIVIAVGGQPVRADHRAPGRSVALIPGDPAPPVSLPPKRKNAPAPIRITVVRRLIYTPTVTSRLMDRGIGYIKLASFGERSDEEVG